MRAYYYKKALFRLMEMWQLIQQPKDDRTDLEFVTATFRAFEIKVRKRLICECEYVTKRCDEIYMTSKLETGSFQKQTFSFNRC